MTLVARAALARGLPFEQFAFPTVGIPEYRAIGPGVEPAIVYAIARQESGFNPREALAAARAASEEQEIPGHTEIIEYEDDKGAWHKETAKMSVDEYRTRFGLPWSRGLTSAASVASSGRTDGRKAKARKLARVNRFFERAQLTPRRAPAPFLKAEAVKNLGKQSVRTKSASAVR